MLFSVHYSLPVMGQRRLLTGEQGVVMLPGLKVHPQLGLLGLVDALVEHVELPLLPPLELLLCLGRLLAPPSPAGRAAGSGVVCNYQLNKICIQNNLQNSNSKTKL